MFKIYLILIYFYFKSFIDNLLYIALSSPFSIFSISFSEILNFFLISSSFLNLLKFSGEIIFPSRLFNYLLMSSLLKLINKIYKFLLFFDI